MARTALARSRHPGPAGPRAGNPPLTRRVPLPNGDTMLVVDKDAFRRGVAAASRVLGEAWERLEQVRERELQAVHGQARLAERDAAGSV